MAESGGRTPHLAGAVDLELWADRIEARATLPSLIRRLIRQTNDQVSTLDMRAAEGTGLPGYDGVVEASRATPLVPSGASVWEMGVNGDVRAKANKDYRERTKDPLGVERASTTFVFVTPRVWAEKRDWAEGKRKKGEWADVRAFDADDLVQAFESAPAVHYWFSELIGKPIDGVRTLESWWDRFAAVSLPNLTPELVLAGRVDQAAALLRVLEEETRITTVSAASVDDVLAFVSGTVLSASDPPRNDLLARALIVFDGASLRRLDHIAELLILLPYEEELARQARLVRAHHVILLASAEVPADIAVPPIDREIFAAALQSVGVDGDDAARFARAAHRSLVAFQHEAPARGAAARSWASAFASQVVRRALLAGGWNETRSGDLDALTSVFGTPYGDVRPELQRHGAGDDPIFTSVGGSWGVASIEAAWGFALPQLTLLDLSAAEILAQTVLGAVDPALELPADQRWTAGIYGKARIHSADLRRGIASSLAACGAYGASTRLSGTGSVADWASGVVANLLRRANDDETGGLWASLSDVLPLLAEAAPEVFVRALREGTT